MTTFGASNATTAKQFEDYFSATSTFSASKRLIETVSKARNGYDDEVWNKMSHGERERILDDAVIDKEQQHRVNNGEKLPMRVSQVFPRLKHPTGQKTVVVDVDDAGGGSQGEDLDSASSSGCVS